MKGTPFISVGALLALIIASACGDDTRTAPTPSVLRMGGGNNQAWIAGLKLPAALDVVLTTAAGAPLANVNVVWTITSGGGIVGGEDTPGHEVVGSVISMPSNLNGHSQVLWTLGPQLGPQSLTAAVPGFAGSPATFSAIATPP